MTDTLESELPEALDPKPGLFADLLAKLDINIGSLATEIAKQNKIRQQELDRLPNYVPLSRVSQPGAAVTDIQDFGGPQPGRVWVVRLLLAFASPLAANASVVTWYVGQNMPGPAAGMLPVTMARWQFPSVPNFEDFSGDHIKIHPGENLIAGLTGIPAASVIGLTAVINDIRAGVRIRE